VEESFVKMKTLCSEMCDKKRERHKQKHTYKMNKNRITKLHNRPEGLCKGEWRGR